MIRRFTLLYFASHLAVLCAVSAAQAGDGSTPPIGSWSELETVTKTTGVYFPCASSERVDRGLVCVSAEHKDDVDAEDRLSARLATTWFRSVRVDGHTLTPDDGRSPQMLPSDEIRASWRDSLRLGALSQYVTHRQTCFYIRRPYHYDVQFYDPVQNRLCVRLVHDRSLASIFLDGLLFR